jgi:branched-chain amino acid transport system substrate-binding protein
LKSGGIKLISLGDVLTEPDLPNIGESGLGLLSTYHYAVSHASPEKKAFLERLAKVGITLDNVTMTSVAAYDGARVLYKMIEATNGKRDPEKALAAVKGMKWISPRGPVSIDPVTRHITQNIYLREVAKQDGKFINKELQTFEAQPDWALTKN